MDASTHRTAGKALLQDFGSRVGLAELGLEAGDCAIAFDDVVLVVEERVVERVLILSAHVHTLAGRLTEGVLRGVAELGSNLALNGLGALSLDPGTGRLLLVERVALAALDAASFEAALEALVKRVEQLRTIVTARSFHGDAGDANREAAFAAMTIIRA